MKQFVGLLIITVLLYILGLLACWSQQAPVLVKYPQWGRAKDHPWWKTRLPKHTFHKETVYIFLPSNIQQPMWSAECLMGNRAFKDTAKRPCLNVIWSLGELMTHTQLSPHYVGLQMQSTLFSSISCCCMSIDSFSAEQRNRSQNPREWTVFHVLKRLCSKLLFRLGYE